jgi:hypothetical protein
MVTVMVSVVVLSLHIVTVSAQATATISGTVRCGGGCGSSYGNPIDAAGFVVAKRTDLPEPLVNASFTAADHGQYELVGLPPGVYNLYASAVGYTTVLGAIGVSVQPSSHYFYDIYLQPCAGCGPVPEFGSQSIAVIVAITAVMATTLILRKVRRKTS